jgi:hypothetical protein
VLHKHPRAACKCLEWQTRLIHVRACVGEHGGAAATFQTTAPAVAWVGHGLTCVMLSMHACGAALISPVTLGCPAAAAWR